MALGIIGRGATGLGRGRPDPAPPSLVLRASPDNRTLCNSQGTPFFLVGDAAWTITVRLTREDMITYFADRQDRGVNAIIVEAIESGTYGGPNNAYGDAPFTTPNDFTTPNSAYWTHVDYMVTTAAKYGIVVYLVPLYFGFNNGGTHGEGWYDQAVTAGTTSIQTYGAFVGNRYKNSDNIIWVVGGDYREPTPTIANALVAGIQSADKRHLMTAHWARDSTGTDGSPSWLTLNSSYTGQADISSRVVTDYGASSLPISVLETVYEDTFGGTTLTATDVRIEAWQSYLSGGLGGHFYGNHKIWQYLTGWQSSLNTGGAQALRYLGAFFRAIDWRSLVPDSGSAMVTAGRGTNGTTGYVSAAKDSAGRLGVAHIPGGGAITVAMSVFRNTVTAQWFDPTAGTYAAVSGSPFTNSGSQVLTPPGGSEKVLLLQAA